MCSGAAGEVTGSGHLVRTPHGGILLDFGLFQGRQQETAEKNRQLLFPISDLSAVVVSHAHLDHVGRLPLLVKRGYHGPIYATAATKELAELILLDAAKIQVQDADYARRHSFADPDQELLYTPEDIPAVMQQFQPVPYWRSESDTVTIGKIQVRFHDAGHILGSAAIRLSWPGSNEERSLVFTGDLGRQDAPLLRDPAVIHDSVNTLIMEATYGLREHHPIDQVYGHLIAVVSEAMARGGKIIVPAFSLGRTQELIYLLHRLTDEGKIPRLPIVIDSPLAGRIQEVFLRHQAEYDEEVKKDFPRRGDAPLNFRNLRFTHSVEESKALNTEPGPMMIISASGMASGGRVTHHLKNNLPDPKNIVLMTGYQADHTPGRRLLNGAPSLRLYGQEVPVRSDIQTINDLSAHADSSELLAYPSEMKDLERILLVHAEQNRAGEFAVAVKERYPGVEVIVPRPGEAIPLDPR